MRTVAVATQRHEIHQRMRDLEPLIPTVRLVTGGTDELSIAALLRTPGIDVLCVEPMRFGQWLTLRRLFREKCTTGGQPRLVLMTQDHDSWFVYKVLAHGVDDVVDFAVPDDRLADAFRSVVEPSGLACIDRLIPQVAIVPVVNAPGIIYADDVDWRIVSLVAAGYTDREIAQIVNYSHQSVRNRVSRILFTSGLRNRTQLAVQHVFERLEEPSGGAWSISQSPISALGSQPVNY